MRVYLIASIYFASLLAQTTTQDIVQTSQEAVQTTPSAQPTSAAEPTAIGTDAVQPTQTDTDDIQPTTTAQPTETYEPTTTAAAQPSETESNGPTPSNGGLIPPIFAQASKTASEMAQTEVSKASNMLFPTRFAQRIQNLFQTQVPQIQTAVSDPSVFPGPFIGKAKNIASTQIPEIEKIIATKVQRAPGFGKVWIQSAGNAMETKLAAAQSSVLQELTTLEARLAGWKSMHHKTSSSSSSSSQQPTGTAQPTTQAASTTEQPQSTIEATPKPTSEASQQPTEAASTPAAQPVTQTTQQVATPAAGSNGTSGMIAEESQRKQTYVYINPHKGSSGNGGAKSTAFSNEPNGFLLGAILFMVAYFAF